MRIPAAHVEEETDLLWRREMLAGSYVPTFVAVETPQGGIAEAVAFVINRQSDRYVQLDIEETARLIATGRGVRGTCLEYLENLTDRLSCWVSRIGRFATCASASGAIWSRGFSPDRQGKGRSALRARPTRAEEDLPGKREGS